MGLGPGQGPGKKGLAELLSRSPPRKSRSDHGCSRALGNRPKGILSNAGLPAKKLVSWWCLGGHLTCNTCKPLAACMPRLCRVDALASRQVTADLEASLRFVFDVGKEDGAPPLARTDDAGRQVVDYAAIQLHLERVCALPPAVEPDAGAAAGPEEGAAAAAPGAAASAVSPAGGVAAEAAASSSNVGAAGAGPEAAPAAAGAVGVAAAGPEALGRLGPPHVVVSSERGNLAIEEGARVLGRWGAGPGAHCWPWSHCQQAMLERLKVQGVYGNVVPGRVVSPAAAMAGHAGHHSAPAEPTCACSRGAGCTRWVEGVRESGMQQLLLIAEALGSPSSCGLV